MDAPMIDNKRHYKSNIIWTVSAIALGTCSYAYNGAIIGSTLGQPSFYVYMGLDEADTDLNAVIGTITGLFYVGGFVGVILNSYLADKIGRKMTSLSAGIILVVSAGCLAGSINVAMFETFRFFAGLGSHMFYLSIPLWVTELVPPKNRGVLVGIVGLNGAIGYLISAWVSVACNHHRSHISASFADRVSQTVYHYKGTPQAQWRLPLAIGSIFPLILLISMPWLPESPRWLLTRDHLYAISEFTQMKQQFELEQHLNSSWLDILIRPSYRKRALIAFLLPVILYSTGNLVITSVISAAVILSVHTALVARFLESHDKAGLSAAAAFLFLFLAFFNFFLEGPSLYYTSEIFPTHLRSKGMAIGVAGFCLVDILWLELAPTAQAAIGWKYYLVFISLSVFGAMFMYTTFPNTLGLPLEEIAKLFGDEDLVAVYQENIHLDHNTHEIVNVSKEGQDKLVVERREAFERRASS
ncbi:hypothetical protein MBLNU459_g7058t1 [Dothideomycetes sp. NU459]